MMDDIGITIITPIYNREDCIEKCILSSVSQNYVNYEHIIIDDGSNDKTKKIAKKYSKQYSNIKFISFANNNGPNYARNRGIEKANKEFVLFLDSDDILLPNSLKFISKVINNNEQFSCYLFLNSDKYKDANKNKILKNNSAIVTLKNHLSSEISLDIDFAYVFKTNTLKDINFNEELKIYEGLTYYKIYQKYGNQFYSKNVICKRDRTRKDSVSKDYILTSNIQLNVALKYLTLIIYNHRSDFIKYGLRKQLSKISFKVAIIKIMLNNKNGLETINLSFFLKLLLNLLSIFNAGKLLKFFYFLYKKQQNNDTI